MYAFLMFFNGRMILKKDISPLSTEKAVLYKVDFLKAIFKVLDHLRELGRFNILLYPTFRKYVDSTAGLDSWHVLSNQELW